MVGKLPVKNKEQKKCIELRSNAKINLSIDVLRKLPDGYHEVRMVMQLLDLYDKVRIGIFPERDKAVKISANLPYIPRDERNLAYRAVLLMIEKFPEHKEEHIQVALKKNIPVAAGLAGGSGNAAAVILGLNKLWNLNMTLKDMIEIGKPLGADVPFMLTGQAVTNVCLGLGDDPMASTCCEAVGKGDEIKPLPRFCSYVVLSKPSISVSTPKVYQALKLDEITEHPDMDKLIEGVSEANHFKIKKNMINVLENVTLKEYPLVKYTKDKMQEACPKSKVLMSGSGPTIYGLYANRTKAERVFEIMKKTNKETYFTKTL